MTIISAFDIPRNTRVAPKDDNTARILGRNRWSPKEGTVTGHARGGDYCLVKWDDDACFCDNTVHWLNLKVL